MFLDNLDNLDNLDTKQNGIPERIETCIRRYQILEPLVNIFEAILIFNYEEVLSYSFFGIILSAISLATGSSLPIFLAVLPFFLKEMRDHYRPFLYQPDLIKTNPTSIGDYDSDIDLHISADLIRERQEARQYGIEIPMLTANIGLNDIRANEDITTPFAMTKIFPVISWIIVAIVGLLSIYTFDGYGLFQTIFSSSVLLSLLWIYYKRKTGKRLKVIKLIIEQRTAQINEVLAEYAKLNKQLGPYVASEVFSDKEVVATINEMDALIKTRSIG